MTEQVNESDPREELPSWVPTKVADALRPYFKGCARPCSAGERFGLRCSREPRMTGFLVARTPIKGGQVQLRLRCTDCGVPFGRAVAKNTPGIEALIAPNEIVEGLDELRRQFDDEVRVESAIAEDKRRNEQEEHRNTPAYKARCTELLKRDGGQCRVCRGPATLIHHRRYAAVVGGEGDDDLVSLCKSCHEAVHALNPVESRWKAQSDPDWFGHKYPTRKP